MGDWKQVSTAADRIQQAMNETGKKQADLAEATGLNKSTISRYLSGQVEPKQKAIMTLAQALDVSEMWLWGYDVPKERAAFETAEPSDDDSELSESQKALIRFVETVPPDKAALVLRTMKAILGDDS